MLMTCKMLFILPGMVRPFGWYGVIGEMVRWYLVLTAAPPASGWLLMVC